MIRQPQPPSRTTVVEAVPTLVLAPHFDDEVLGCGGLVSRLCQAGAPVHVLFLTDGSGGIEEIDDRASYAQRRRGESERVIRLLGCAGAEVLGIRDGALAAGRAEAAAAIRRHLLEQRPGLILVPSPLEVSEDHRAAFAALYDVLSSAVEAAGAGGEDRRSPADPDPATGATLATRTALADAVRGLEVWLYEVNHPGYPDRLVDVSDCRTTIEQAMAIYASQEERHPYLRAGIGLRQFRTHTLAPQVALVEGYRRLAASDFAARELAALVAEVGGSVPELGESLIRTRAEIVRLNAVIRAMEGTRAWRLHRWVARLRGGSGPRSEPAERAGSAAPNGPADSAGPQGAG